VADTDPGSRPNMKFEDYEFGSADQRAFFEARFSPYARRQAEIERLQADQKDHLLACKQDGIPAALIKDAYKDAKAEDPQKVSKRIKFRSLVASWFGILAPGWQTDMFDAVQPQEEGAYERGRIDGVSGKDKANPYDKSLPQFAKYEDGYKVGKDASLAKLKTTLEKGNAAAAKKADKEPGGGSGGKAPSPAAKRAEEAAAKRDRVEEQKAKTAAAQKEPDPVLTGGKAGDDHIKEQIEKRRLAALEGGGSAPVH
jgi:hypothetical protein